ncbi:PREDICTED: floral homeotic protein PMADS 1 isoform X1 [Theobroma cacao]|uniref:Floral homeotic protein PMADS 1 isoform X1 n=2 Tax=Theobroma cacao TaxID=3641 RepID=A0AB32VM63_THECC|nr:PREDICTED: floral homeotic protein PMADS 1 isoform X1 [Theobroma cacao]EOX90932.1 Floral homeotic protein DEFICIENS, putative isoform 2 [Theobroma cacao]
MGRGKIEIKKIENTTNRQVTYSKRRNGIFKKAQELTVLCDAKVSLIMFSSSGKFHEFISPNISTKTFFDLYQKTLGIDLWSSHYEKMQENYRRLKEINNRLRREISRQRIGEDLDDLNIKELQALEAKMASSLEAVRQRKYHVIKTQTDTYKKKVRNLEQRHANLVLDLEAKLEDGIVENEAYYESSMGLANGASNLYALRLHQNHQVNLLHHGGRFGPNDLRLA